MMKYNVHIFPYNENGEASDKMLRIEKQAASKEKLLKTLKPVGVVAGVGKIVTLTK